MKIIIHFQFTFTDFYVSRISEEPFGMIAIEHEVTWLGAPCSTPSSKIDFTNHQYIREAVKALVDSEKMTSGKYFFDRSPDGALISQPITLCVTWSQRNRNHSPPKILILTHSTFPLTKEKEKNICKFTFNHEFTSHY